MGKVSFHQLMLATLVILVAGCNLSDGPQEYNERASSFLAAGDTSSAIITLQEGLRELPAEERDSLSVKLAQIYIDERRYEELMRLLRYSKLGYYAKSDLYERAATSSFVNKEWQISFRLSVLAAQSVDAAWVKQKEDEASRGITTFSRYDYCKPFTWWASMRNATAAAFNGRFDSDALRIGRTVLEEAQKCGDMSEFAESQREIFGESKQDQVNEVQQILNELP